MPPNLATIDNEIPDIPLKVTNNNVPQRSTRFKEKKRNSSTIEIDSVKDVLKNIREKSENQTIDHFRYR